MTRSSRGVGDHMKLMVERRVKGGVGRLNGAVMDADDPKAG